MTIINNTQYRKPLPGSNVDYYDTQEAVDAIKPGAYATLPYTCLLYTSDAADE